MSQGDQESAEKTAVPMLDVLARRLFNAIEGFRKTRLNPGPAIQDVSAGGIRSYQLNVASAKRATVFVGSVTVDVAHKGDDALVSVRCGNLVDTEAFPVARLNADKVAQWLEQRLEDIVPQAGRCTP